jgi:hypothetical protein
LCRHEMCARSWPLTDPAQQRPNAPAHRELAKWAGGNFDAALQAG